MVVLTVVFILYFLLIALFLVGWKRATHVKPEVHTAKDLFISVIVPVRNEELTIGNLLTALAAQQYKNFEIIVVNDDSEDETLWMVSRYDMKNLQVIHSRGKGKKAAISAGVKVARGAIIVTTDADCSVPPEWLRHIGDHFRNPRAMMAFGGVRLTGDDNFFHSLQAMEFSSLIGAGASTAAFGFPSLCNGANLAYRKKAFSDVKGYEDNMAIPSGDDEFLMRKIHQRYPGGIEFLNSHETVVSTGSQPSPERLINQRIRWASKWRYNSSIFAKSLAVIVLLFQLSCMINWFYVFTPFILQSLFLIAVKMILEAAFLLQVCRFLGAQWNWLGFFALQILYPPYVVGVGVASVFVPFEWKKRIFKPAPFRRP
jgi:poly-beta-1,6-N-acetyl-D-glucosamine synthase